MTPEPGLADLYPSLWLFFGGYMYPHWRDEFPDEWALADAFVRDEPESATMFPAEMEKLLLRYPDEVALRDVLLNDFRAAARVETRGWKYRHWLRAMSDHVARATGHPQAS